MADGQPTMRTVLGRPFAEQVAFYRNKLGNLVPTARWDDIKRDAHDTGFMVAGAAKADLLADLAMAVDRAVTEGKGLGEFRKDFRDIVQRNGWHGWTGEGTRAGERWRTRTIYQANAITSYSAGRLAQLQEGDFAYWIYRHNDSVRNPRPEHQKLDGLTLPAKHPMWRRYYPPNGWGCQCYVVGARTAAGARRLGGREDDNTPPEGWDAEQAPGIDDGWDYQPGARVVQAVTQMAEKSRAWPYEIAKGYMQGVPEHLRDQLARSYRALPSVADDARRYAQRVLRGEDPDQIPPYRTLGLLSAADVAQVSQVKELAVGGYDYALDVSTVRHVQRKHGGSGERARGQRPVTAADYAVLPRLLNEGGELLDAGAAESTGAPLVRRELTVGNETFVGVFEVRRKRKMLVLQTFYVRVRK